MTQVGRVLPLLLLPLGPLAAQERGAGALAGLVSGLSVSARVLIVGAHPDDEDTQIITWLSRARHVETAYLSLTRGDGGQNLIGNELGEALGAIRTEELFAARRVDGGRQYFGRAYDFGFSRSAAETFTKWPHDSLLLDVVTVVRSFRPHVIVGVFTGTPRDGHGQHQASGIIAREAYDLSADTVRFPRAATRGHGPWTVSKFYRGASFRQEQGTLRINVGEYDPLSGRSYGEIAATSRSQHRSQGFGTLERRGVRWDFLQREATRVPAPEDPGAEQSIFDGIDTTWARLRPAMPTPAARAALDSLPAAFAAVRAAYDVFHPERLLPNLAIVQRLLGALCPGGGGGSDSSCLGPGPAGPRVSGGLPTDAETATMVGVARARVNEALVLATGVAVEAAAAREVWALGEPIPVQVTTYNRGRQPVNVLAWSAAGDAAVRIRDFAMPGAPLAPDSARVDRDTIELARPTMPAWLAAQRAGAMFATTGNYRTMWPASVTVSMSVGGAAVAVHVPVVYRYADQVKGEINRPIAGAPAVSVLLDHDIEYAPANAALDRQVRVHLTSAASDTQRVSVTLKLPEGLAADTSVRGVTLPGPGSVRTATFTVRGRLAPGRHAIEAIATSGANTFTQGFTTIDYDHIRPQRLYRPSSLALEAVDLAGAAGLEIAYIAGVGDNVAPMLEQLGIRVTQLDPERIPQTDLAAFDAVVVGARAYEASPALVANNARLLEYVRSGGRMVVQYGQYEMMRPGIMPYPVTINRPHDRVTIEESPVSILEPRAAVLDAPNRITERDFDGWVQDRSLYMPRTFDERYRPALELHDPGEPPNRGALLVAPYGRGTYVYTTLAFFRQLPNGVPGAARLFVNLLRAGAPSP